MPVTWPSRKMKSTLRGGLPSFWTGFLGRPTRVGTQDWVRGEISRGKTRKAHLRPNCQDTSSQSSQTTYRGRVRSHRHRSASRRLHRVFLFAITGSLFPLSERFRCPSSKVTFLVTIMLYWARRAVHSYEYHLSSALHSTTKFVFLCNARSCVFTGTRER